METAIMADMYSDGSSLGMKEFMSGKCPGHEERKTCSPLHGAIARMPSLIAGAH